MSDTAIASGPTPETGPPQVKSEQQWLDDRRKARAAPANEPEPAPEPEPTAEEAEPVEVEEQEAETEELTREDADLHSEGSEAEEAEDSTAEEADEPFPETVKELAESLGFEPEQLSDHLQITVRPNGKEETVSLAELAKGYERHQDYKAKTQRLADERRDFESTSKQALERQNAAIQQLDTVAMALAQEIDQGPSDAELERVKQEDRFRYYDLVEQRNKRVQAFQQAQAMRQKVQEDAQEESRQSILKYRKEQQGKLADRLEEMRDPEKVKAFEGSVKSFLTSPEIGYTDKEVTEFINGPFDHRMILVIRAAVQAAEAGKVQTKVKKKVKKLPKVRSGARRSDAQRQGDQMRSAKAVLRRDQSTEAGLALLKARRLARRNANHGGSQ